MPVRVYTVADNLSAASIDCRRVGVFEGIEQQHRIVFVGKSFLDLVLQLYSRNVGAEGKELNSVSVT